MPKYDFMLRNLIERNVNSAAKRLRFTKTMQQVPKADRFLQPVADRFLQPVKDDRENYAFICASEVEKSVGGVDDATFNELLEKCRKDFDCIHMMDVQATTENPMYIAMINRFGQQSADTRWGILKHLLCENDVALHRFFINLVNGIQ